MRPPILNANCFRTSLILTLLGTALASTPASAQSSPTNASQSPAAPSVSRPTEHTVGVAAQSATSAAPTSVARQADDLYALAVRLEAEVNQSNRYILSLGALRDVDAIGRQAHQMKAEASR